MTQEEFNAMLQVALAGGLAGYYTSLYSNEEQDTAIGQVLDGQVVIPSSTQGSAKRFLLQVDDAGTITAVETTVTRSR